MKDIEYEKDGVRKFAGECFKEALIAVGWTVVEEKQDATEQDVETPKKRGRKAKVK